MLKKIIDKLNITEEPMTLKDLSRELDIDAEALKGMLEYLNRKGLVAFQPEHCPAQPFGSCSECGMGCTIKKLK